MNKNEKTGLTIRVSREIFMEAQLKNPIRVSKRKLGEDGYEPLVQGMSELDVVTKLRKKRPHLSNSAECILSHSNENDDCSALKKSKSVPFAMCSGTKVQIYNFEMLGVTESESESDSTTNPLTTYVSEGSANIKE